MCDTMVTLTDRGVLFAKNSDRDTNESQHLDWQAAARHEPGSSLRCTWIEIPQVERTRAVLLSRPWWIWGAEMGANDAGVVIGNEAVFTDAHEDAPGLLGMDLVRLALERADDAAAAVQVIVSLLETHGQGGSASYEHPGFSYDNSFLIADPAGAWVLETAGRRWAAEPVVGHARSISNGLTIAGFAEHHADRLRSRVSRCALRRARTTAAASAAHGVPDLAAALRDHGGGGPCYSPVNGAMAAPCMHAGGLLASSQTTSSWISDLRDAPQHWATATAAPCTSIFKPVRVDQPVDLGPVPTNVADLATVWWRHEVLHRRVVRDVNALLPRYAHERDRTERMWFADPPESATAFDRADELERRWLADVLDGPATDRRPVVARRHWRRQDRNSGLELAMASWTGRPREQGGNVSRAAT
ncbi:MAG: peptidase U34 [Microthrixaceae bacterium]